MSDLQTKTVAVIRAYSRDAAIAIQLNTKMRDLGLDDLDLPMIFLDLEDAVGTSLTYDDEATGFETVAELVTCVERRLNERRLRALVPHAPKAKRGWMSTGTQSR